MSKMAKFLAAKKGKSSVKASADTALKAALNIPDIDSTPDLLDNLQAVTKAETDDWGVDSDTEPATGSVVVGGHFHLISEEDVSKKQQRKPRKWGEVAAVPDKIEETSAVVETTPAAAEESLKPILYRPGVRRKVAKPIDVQNEENFPGLGDLGPKPSGTSAPKKKEKKAEEKTIEKAEKCVAVEKSDPGKEEPKQGSSLMLIEEFLHDVVKPKINLLFNDEASRNKFIGRKKLPRVPLPAREQ